MRRGSRLTEGGLDAGCRETVLKPSLRLPTTLFGSRLDLCLVEADESDGEAVTIVGRNALVMGGNAGIRLAATQAFDGAEARILVVTRDRERLRRARAKFFTDLDRISARLVDPRSRAKLSRRRLRHATIIASKRRWPSIPGRIAARIASRRRCPWRMATNTVGKSVAMLVPVNHTIMMRGMMMVMDVRTTSLAQLIRECRRCEHQRSQHRACCQPIRHLGPRASRRLRASSGLSVAQSPFLKRHLRSSARCDSDARNECFGSGA